MNTASSIPQSSLLENHNARGFSKLHAATNQPFSVCPHESIDHGASSAAPPPPCIITGNGLQWPPVRYDPRCRPARHRRRPQESPCGNDYHPESRASQTHAGHARRCVRSPEHSPCDDDDIGDKATSQS